MEELMCTVYVHVISKGYTGGKIPQLQLISSAACTSYVRSNGTCVCLLDYYLMNVLRVAMATYLLCRCGGLLGAHWLDSACEQ